MNMIEKGFDHAVHDAQCCFRRILKALSEPGTLMTLDKHLGFSPLNAASSQIVMSLCDTQVGLYLSSALAADQKKIEQSLQNFTFHNGVSRCDLSSADFVVIDAGEAFDLSGCKAGCEMYPEKAATVIVQTDGFDCGPRYRVSGPGIADTKEIQLGHLSEALQTYLMKPLHRYPMGLDFMFCHEDKLVAISRTTQVELMSCM